MLRRETLRRETLRREILRREILRDVYIIDSRGSGIEVLLYYY